MSNTVIDFKPTLKQKYIFELFNDEVTTEIIWGGSVGGGKSYALAALMVMKCLQYNGIRVGLARNNLTTLKRTTVISIMEVFADWGLKPDEHYNYNSQAGIIKFYNGSEIILVELQFLPSDSQYARLGGLLLTFIVIDEIQECDEKGKQIFQTRAGRWMNRETKIKPILIGTCNPSKTSFIYRDYYIPFKEGRLKSYQKFVQVLPSDNPHLPKEYIENLTNTLSLTERKRLLHGNWELDDDEEALFKYEDINLIFDTSIKFDADKTMRMSCDIAFTSDKCVFVIWEGLTVIDIVTYDKMNDNTVVDKIKELATKYKIRTDNISYDADGVGKYIKQYLSSAKEIHNGGKTIVNDGYRNLKAELYFKMSELVKEGRLKVEGNIWRREIEEELSCIKHKPRENMDNKIELIPKSDMKRLLGRSPDIADAMAYNMIFHLKNNRIKANQFIFV
jgi:hypothetical protein